MDKTRRNLVLALGTSVASIPLASLAISGSANAAEVKKLDPKSPPAIALSYTHKSSNSSKVCAGCQFYSQPESSWGPCLIFPGVKVSAKGTCKSWFARPG